VIYVNGDSHSAGADIIPGICFAQDDPRYLAYGRRAHPEAVIQTYGYHVAKALNQGFFCEAESGSSNDRILRLTKKTIDQAQNKKNLSIIIGWSTWDREEWQDGEDFIQVTASGTDSVPESMEEEYKEWVINQTPEEHKRKEQLWHDRIWNFHCELKEQNIRHVFFNTYDYFNETTYQKDWNDQYINPYDKDFTYYYYLKDKGIKTVNENSHHYSIDGHRIWRNLVLENLVCQYHNINSVSDSNRSIPNYKRTDFLGLTETTKRSIITQVKQEFKGFKR